MIPVFLLAISHPVCLRHRCTLIVWQMKMVGVAAGTSMKKKFTMWANAMEMKIQGYIAVYVFGSLSVL